MSSVAACHVQNVHPSGDLQLRCLVFASSNVTLEVQHMAAFFLFGHCKMPENLIFLARVDLWRLREFVIWSHNG